MSSCWLWNDARVIHDRRLSSVAALVELAGSDGYGDRADAGRALANFAQTPASREPLLRLLLDANDTYVTRATAEALLRRRDAAGFAIVAEALASADPQHSTYIDDAVRAVFGVFASERDEAIKACEALSSDASAAIRQGAADLRKMLAEIDPVLYPHEPS